MSDLSKIFYTSAVAILSGVIIFYLQQLVSEIFIPAIADQRKLRSDIKHSLKYYANIYANPGRCKEEYVVPAEDKFRELASSLDASLVAVPFYCMIAKIKFVLPMTNVLEAYKKLILLSNSCRHAPLAEAKDSGRENSRVANEIEKLLDLK